MEDRGATQVLDPADEPVTEAGTAGGPPPGGRAPGANSAGGKVPRRWLLAAIVVVLLLLAGVAALVLLDGEDSGASQQLEVPNVLGMSLERATQEIERSAMAPGAVAHAIVEESVAPSGTVLSQRPLQGELADPGTKIDIVLARGPAPAETTQGGEPSAQPVAVVEEQTAQQPTQQPPAQQPPAAEPALPTEPPATIDPKLVAQPLAVDKKALLSQFGWTSRLLTGGSETSFQSGIFAFEGTGDKRAVLTLFGSADCAWSVLLMNVANDTQWRWVGFAHPEVKSGTFTYTIPLNEYAGIYKVAVVGNATNGSHTWNLDVQEKQ